MTVFKPPHPLAIVNRQVLAQVDKPTLALVTNLVDDSGSITSHGNAPAIRSGHNTQLDAYRDHLRAHPKTKMLVTTRYLNGHVLFKDSELAAAVGMDEVNYNPDLNTPLYDATFDTLTEVERSAALFADKYDERDVITVSYIITDGNDNASSRRAQDVRAVVERMLKSGRHMVVGIGVHDGHTNFSRVFFDMGIPERFIQVWGRSADEIAKGMSDTTHFTVSSTVSSAAFSKSTMTGFHQPPPAAQTVQPHVGTSAPAQPAAQQKVATEAVGTMHVADMMGAKVERSEVERGDIAPDQLLWEPMGYSYQLDRSSGTWKRVMPSTLFAWDTSEGTHGLYSLRVPLGTCVVLGRAVDSWDEETRYKMAALATRLASEYPKQKIVYATIRDKRTKSAVSRVHALIAPYGDAPDATEHTIQSLGKAQHVSILPSDDPDQDKYLQDETDGPAFLSPGYRVKLAPDVVFRVHFVG